jgi:hypothetical protein
MMMENAIYTLPTVMHQQQLQKKQELCQQVCFTSTPDLLEVDFMYAE